MRHPTAGWITHSRARGCGARTDSHSERRIFEFRERALVHLVLPRLQMGLRNVTAGDEATCRYVVDVVETEDENAPGNPQRIEIRRPQVRLIIGKKEEVAGYDALPIVRLRLGSAADAFPEIDPDYIPPILACDAWPLLKQLITGIYDYLGASEREAQQMIDHGVSFESGGRTDLELILKLQTINASLELCSKWLLAGASIRSLRMPSCAASWGWSRSFIVTARCPSCRFTTMMTWGRVSARSAAF